MNEPTRSQLDWARQKLSGYNDPLSTADLAEALGDDTTRPVVAAIRAGRLGAIEKRSGPRTRYSIPKEDAIPFLASHRRQPIEEQK